MTFNGSSFDLPILSYHFPLAVPRVPHFDLRHACRRVGLTGGLKSVEKQMGIARAREVEFVTGEEAVYLWRAWERSGRPNALKLLKRYNEEDTVNLRPIAEHTYEMLKSRIVRLFKTGVMLLAQVRDVNGFERAAKDAADLLRSAASVQVVGHIDADGITASSIASLALYRQGIDHSVRFVKKLDPAEIERADATEAERLWFVDLGSGALSALDPGRSIVTDHHQVDPDVEECWQGHVNPHQYGLDGATEVSGAGVTYLVAKMMDPRNMDLSALAVVGAVGDFQDAAETRLVGYNRTILDDAVSHGLVTAEKDVRLFGRQTRPLHSLLQYSSEPALMPYIGRRPVRQADMIVEDQVQEDDDKLACIDFLEDLGIAIEDDGRFRTWSQLEREEKRVIVSALVNRIADRGRGLPMVRRLIGEVYTLSPDLPGTPPVGMPICGKPGGG